MGNTGVFVAIASAFAAAAFARGLKMRDLNATSWELIYYAVGAFFLAGAALFWISLEEKMLVQHKIFLGVLGAIFGALALPAIGEWVRPNAAEAQTQPSYPSSGVVGAEIIGNNQGGIAQEIVSNGMPGAPSTGAEISAQGGPGQSVTGLRVIQNGPGTALKINQNGPGTALRVTVGKENSGEK